MLEAETVREFDKMTNGDLVFPCHLFHLENIWRARLTPNQLQARA